MDGAGLLPARRAAERQERVRGRQGALWAVRSAQADDPYSSLRGVEQRGALAHEGDRRGDPRPGRSGKERDAVPPVRLRVVRRRTHPVPDAIRAAARGFSGDEAHFDEAHFLGEPAHAALRPTRADAQPRALSKPSTTARGRPDPAQGVLVVTRLRLRGIAGDEGIDFVETASASSTRTGTRCCRACPGGDGRRPGDPAARESGMPGAHRSTSCSTRHAPSTAPHLDGARQRRRLA